MISDVDVVCSWGGDATYDIDDHTNQLEIIEHIENVSGDRYMNECVENVCEEQLANAYKSSFWRLAQNYGADSTTKIQPDYVYRSLSCVFLNAYPDGGM